MLSWWTDPLVREFRSPFWDMKMAAAARIATIATTIIISINVKPRGRRMGRTL
jgi:hypothetical protein